MKMPRNSNILKKKPASKPAPKSKPIDKAGYEAMASFRTSLRHFLRFSEEAALAAGLAPQKHQALLAIKGFPERDRITVGELAEMLQIRHHSAGNLATRLEADGLLRRKPDAKDHRKVFIRLTAAGSAILKKLAAAHTQELQQMRGELKTILNHLEHPQEKDREFEPQ